MSHYLKNGKRQKCKTEVPADLGFPSALYQECLFHNFNAVSNAQWLRNMSRPTEGGEGCGVIHVRG
jgi:hypothetical protein